VGQLDGAQMVGLVFRFGEKRHKQVVAGSILFRVSGRVAGEQSKKLYSWYIYIYIILYRRGSSKKANTKSIGQWRFLQRVARKGGSEFTEKFCVAVKSV